MAQTTVLVPLDGSSFSERALPIALGLAKLLDASVELVTVAVGRPPAVPMGDAWASPEALTAAIEAASHYLSQVGRRAAEVTSIPLRGELLLPSPLGEGIGHVLVNRIEESAPELVVMSTHGRGALSRAWMGSVANWVAHHTTVPLLLVRPEKHSEVVFDDTNRFHHILIPLDGSEQAEASLEWAKRIGKPGHALFSLVRVAPRSFPVWSSYLRNGYPDVRDYAELGRAGAMEYLRGVECGLQEGGFDTVSVVEDTETTAAGILRQVEKLSPDLITIATHGRNGLPRLVLGSVADKVVRGSQVPVLVVRHAKRRTP